MNIEFLPEARSELLDAYEYYEDQASGLGACFWAEVDAHIEWIAKHHIVPRPREGGYRRVNLRIFPYYIAYSVQGEKIWIFAIAHGRRKPNYFIARSYSVHEPIAPYALAGW